MKLLVSRGIAILLLFFTILQAGCTSSAGPGGPSNTVNVVTTITVFSDLIQQVGQDRVNIRSLVPQGVDPHTYQQTPQDVRDISQAQIIFINGLGLEGPLETLVRNTAKPDAKIIVLSDDLPVITDNQQPAQPGATSGNPHMWLDVQYAEAYVREIQQGLSSVDPAGASVYEQNASKYLGELMDLDTWIQQQINTIPQDNRKLVTFHDAFPYYCRRYGLELVGVVLRNPGTEPSARDVADLVNTIKRENVRTIFVEPQFNPSVMQVIAQEAGVSVAVLYSDSTSADIATYSDLMRYDTDQIVNGLR